MTIVASLVPQLDLLGAGQALLDLIVGLLGDQGVAVPPAQVVVPGNLPAWDGEQLTVNLDQLSLGYPGREDTQDVYPLAIQQHVTWAVELLRTVSTAEGTGIGTALPTPSEVAADGATLVTDVQALWSALVTIKANYLLVPPGVPLTVGPMTPMGPSGGLAGTRCLVGHQVT